MTYCHTPHRQILCQLYLNIYFSNLKSFLITRKWGKKDYTLGRLGYLSHSNERDLGN